MYIYRYIYIYVLFFSNLPPFPSSSVLSLRRGVFQWGVQRRNHCSSDQSSKGRTDQFSRGVDVPRFFQKWLCGAEVWWFILMGAGKIQKYDFPSSWLVLWEENHLVDEPRNFGLIISDWGRLATYSSKTTWAHRSPLSWKKQKWNLATFTWTYIWWDIRDAAATLRIEWNNIFIITYSTKAWETKAKADFAPRTCKLKIFSEIRV